MQYRIKETGVLMSLNDIIQLHPEKTLPSIFNKDTCEFLGIDPVLESPKPETKELEVAVIVGAVQDSKGNWVQKYEVKPMFETKEEEENFLLRKKEEVSNLVRKQRNELLSSSVDKINAVRWNSMNTAERDAWTNFRQQLLDVPLQEGFPFDVIWPTQPE